MGYIAGEMSRQEIFVPYWSYFVLLGPWFVSKYWVLKNGVSRLYSQRYASDWGFHEQTSPFFEKNIYFLLKAKSLPLIFSKVLDDN